MRRAAYVVMVVLSLGIAGYAFVVYGTQPLGVAVHPDMKTSFESHPWAVYTHAFGASVALLLGPFQFWTRLRESRPAVHRAMGKLVLGVGVLVGGLAGLYLAFHAYGGLVGKLGFGVLALAWLFSGTRAYAAIRAGRITSHRRWMVRNFSLAFAAVMLRIWLPLAAVAGLSFDSAYPVIAWLSWVPNLVVAELLFNRGPSAAAPRGADPMSGHTA